jgi:hypothetical protein
MRMDSAYKFKFACRKRNFPKLIEREIVIHCQNQAAVEASNLERAVARSGKRLISHTNGTI